MDTTPGPRIKPAKPKSRSIGQAKAILAMEEDFLGFAQGLARGERGHLRVGLAGAVSLLPIIPQTIRRFREAWPEVIVSFEESNTPALSEALHDRRVDVAIDRSRETAHESRDGFPGSNRFFLSPRRDLL